MRALTLSLCLLAGAAQADYTSINDTPVSLKKSGWQHLVFINIWDSYAQPVAETRVENLPAAVRDGMDRVWVSSELNITQAYLKDYQSAFTASKPLIIDKGYQLMRRFELWQTPAHVLLKDGEAQFVGSGDELDTFTKDRFPTY